MADKNIKLNEPIRGRYWIDISRNLSINTRYKNIHFEVVNTKSEYRVWSCRKNRAPISLRTDYFESGNELGLIKFDPASRKYYFFPTAEGVFSSCCLRDIAEFINILNNTYSI